MKIAQVVNTLNVGGAEKVVVDTSMLFKQYSQQCDVIVLNAAKSIFGKELIENQVKIVNIAASNIYNPILIFKLVRILKQYDAVIVHLFPAQYWVAFARLLIPLKKIRLITVEHSNNNRRRNSCILRIVDKFVYSIYDKVVSISQQTNLSLITWLGLENRTDKFRVIRNGVDLSRINEAKTVCKEEFGVPSSAKIVMCVGRLEEVKNHMMQFRALQLCDANIHLVLVGDGSLRLSLEKAARELEINDRVHFLGIRNDIPGLLKSADVALLTSKWEGLSLACVEGMAVCPFIGTDVAGIKDIIQNYGVLVPLDDEQALAEAITELMKSAEYYDVVKTECRLRAEQFDIHQTVEQYLSLINEN